MDRFLADPQRILETRWSFEKARTGFYRREKGKRKVSFIYLSLKHHYFIGRKVIE
jgi:hypothetical protein